MSLRGYDVELEVELGGIDVFRGAADPVDDDFESSTLDSKWTWLNQGDTVATIWDGRLILTLGTSANQWRGLYVSAPSGNWTIRSKCYVPSAPTSSSYGGGLFVGQSNTQQQRWAGFYAAEYRCLHHSTPTSGISSSGGVQSDVINDAYYLEAEWDGTDLVFRLSLDGYAWMDLNSTALGYTPGIVGLGIHNFGGVYMLAEFDWIRRVA